MPWIHSRFVPAPFLLLLLPATFSGMFSVIFTVIFLGSVARRAQADLVSGSRFSSSYSENDELAAPSERHSRRRHSRRSYRSDDSRPGSYGSGRDFGLGVQLGEPTGLNAKYWMTRESALQFDASYSFNDYFSLGADYLYHFTDVFPGRVGSQFVPYLGFGLVTFFGTGPYGENDYNRSNGSFDFGFRIPVGVEFLPRRAPIGVWAELAPGLGVVPATFGFIQAVVGIRFYI